MINANDLYLILWSRYYSKGPFHFKDQTLNCSESKLLVKIGRGYSEVIIDLQKSQLNEHLWVAYYFARIWYRSEPFEEMQLCKKCAKNAFDSIGETFEYPQVELINLIDLNKKMIQEAVTSWPN